MLNHCVVEYGGGCDRSGNVEVGSWLREGRLTLTNSELRDGDGRGVYVHSGSIINDDVCETNTFAGNAQGECYTSS